ncbi:MAG: hypothetical protein AAGD38_16945 [Acidobacteriota bacterium]
MLKGTFRVLLVLALFLTPYASSFADDPSDAEARIEARRVLRLANAEPTRLVTPHFSVAGGDHSTLYMISKIGQPVMVDVTLLTDEGEAHGLGSFLLDAHRHTAFALRDLIANAGREDTTGSLRVDFSGDPTMVQSWVVLGNGRQVVELPLIATGDDDAWQHAGFWDTRLLHNGVAPHLYVVNGSDTAVDYKLSLQQGDEVVHAVKGTIAAGARERFSPLDIDPALDHGHVWLRVDGAPGSLIATGVLEANPGRRAAGHLSRIDIAPSVLANPYTELSSLAMPIADARRLPVTVLGLDGPTSLDVVLVALESGRELTRVALKIPAGDIQSLDLLPTLARIADLPTEGRLQILADRPVVARASSELANGEVVEVPLFGLEQAHQSGLYPLPSLDDHEVFSTLVNVGDRTTTILGQISWRGGVYALQPLEIPPGEARRIDFATVVSAGSPDLLGRSPDPAYQDGFFQWTARDSHQVIARTEVRPHGSADRFGFNCGSCCEEESYGSMVPSSITVNFGTPTSFAGVEYISTCNGTLGPYTIFSFGSLSYSSPVTWNGNTVSSSDVTDQTVSFTSWGDTVFDDGWECTQGIVQFGDDGPVRSDPCQQQHHPEFDPTKPCSGQSSSCPNCYTCCDKQNTTADCRCNDLPGGLPRTICKTAAETKCEQCKLGCNGVFANGCSSNTNC